MEKASKQENQLTKVQLEEKSKVEGSSHIYTSIPYQSPFKAADDLSKPATAPLSIIQGFKGGHGVDFYQKKPVTMTGKQAASILLGKKHFAIVTGAGISAASGIPTFRGDNGFWTRSYGGVTDPMKVMTEKFFYANPHLVWEWHYDFMELVEKCRPNQSHYALNKFLEYCKTQKNECCMITQNIDDFDAELIRQSKILSPTVQEKVEGTNTYAFTEHIIEMHGNVRFMHCSNYESDCCYKFYKSPVLGEVTDKTNCVPLCKECGHPMRPHCMFFDESYSEHFYKAQTTRDLELDMDILIVIGTALATSGAKGMVMRALEKQKIPVIEINMDPIVNEGWVINIPGKSEVVLEEMFNEYYKLMQAKQAKPKAAVKK